MNQKHDASEGVDAASQRDIDVARWGPVLGDPCPKRRLLDMPVLGGSVKAREEDFLVQEMPLYEPRGEGEHLYLSIQKRGMPHSEMLEILKRHFKVRESAIGAAGMKDRIAITNQTVSIHLPGREPPTEPINDSRLEVLWTSRHQNKLRRGHLKGNRFVIRIRDLDPLQAPQVWRGLKELERRGVPNYYGMQRFGYRRNTQRLGSLLLRKEDEELVHEILGSKGSWYPPHQQIQREAFDEGRFSDALPHWGPRDVAERVVLSRLISGAPPKAAIRAISRHMRIFWASAIQSAIFNHMLNARLKDNTIDQILEGDIAFRHQSRTPFLVDKATMGAEDQQARSKSFEISPSGPILGTGTKHAEGEVGRMEDEIITSAGVPEECFTNAGFDLKGTRRPYRVPVTNTNLESGFDEHGTYVRVAFDLPRGAYATVVLREILGEESVDSTRARPREDSAREAGDDIR